MPPVVSDSAPDPWTTPSKVPPPVIVSVEVEPRLTVVPTSPVKEGMVLENVLEILNVPEPCRFIAEEEESVVEAFASKMALPETIVDPEYVFEVVFDRIRVPPVRAISPVPSIPPE